MKKSELKMMIREVVREEIRMALKEVIGGSKQPVQKPKSKQKQNYSKNPVLNEVLNDTNTEDWETMGGTTYTSERMGELVGDQYVGDQYKNLMNDNQPQTSGVVVDGKQPDFLKKDYRELMNAVDKKKQQKMGG